MADNAAMMKLIQDQQAQPAQGGESTPGMPSAEPSTPPMASPMSTPEPQQGSQEAAKVNVQMALDLLEQTLPALGSESPEGQGILKAISSLTRLFGASQAKTKELVPSEIMQMIQNLPQSGANPEMMQASSQQNPSLQQPPQPM